MPTQLWVIKSDPQPVSHSLSEPSPIRTLHLPHGLVGMILPLFHRRRHQGTERFRNLPEDTQLVRGT